ncbi:hypothetical protein [Luteibacter sp. E-22]|jgi:hypothetical protein|uniref:hypothetical protein n=1 Tax=Luteibacter sp. E-22 TaxID=3404050 RepID=UPI003CF6A18D
MSDVKVSVGVVSQKAIAKGKSGATIIEVSVEVLFEGSRNPLSYPQRVSTYLLTSSDGKVLPGQFSKDDAANALMAHEKKLSQEAEDSLLLEKGEWPTPHIFGLKGRPMYEKDQDERGEQKIDALELERDNVARLLSGAFTMVQLSDADPMGVHIEMTAYVAHDHLFRWLDVPQSEAGARKRLAEIRAGIPVRRTVPRPYRPR